MRKKRKKLIEPVVVGFTVLYLLVMGLTTYLTAEKFADDYVQRKRTEWSNMGDLIGDKENSLTEDWSPAEKSSWYQSVINGSGWQEGAFVDLSAAAYDEEGNLLAKRRNTVGGQPVTTLDSTSFFCRSFALDERLSTEDIDRLAKYQYEANQSDEREEPPRYRLCIRVSDDGEKLYEILVQHLTWEPGDDAWKKGYEDPLLGGHHSYRVMPDIVYSDGITPDDVYNRTENPPYGGDINWYETDS